MDKPGLLLLALLLLSPHGLQSAGQEVNPQPAVCNCNLQDELQFLSLRSRVQEHSVPESFSIDISSICDQSCVVFDRLPSTVDIVHQGNWSIGRDGTIFFDHRPHKTGVARLNITVEEVSSSANYTAQTAYFVVIEEDPDYPQVFASQAGMIAELTEVDSVRHQHRNLTLSVEQNTGNNTVYADLLLTVGVFDFDADEFIRVELPDDYRPRLGRLIGSLNDSVSARALQEPSDCDLTDPERLAGRNLTEWDTSLTVWHPCNLSLPYPPAELSWFSHLLRYRPGLHQTGVDSFVLAYIDKYRLESRLYIRVHILQNPCINDGLCWGPAWDPDCQSNVRSEGFFNRGYLCQCPTGWVGDRCEIDFDDCSSSPCPSPFVCVDKFRGYDCVCPENLASCQPMLPAWQLAAILLGLAACVCVIGAGLILASQRAPIVLPLGKSRPVSQQPTMAAEAADPNGDIEAVESSPPEEEEEEEEEIPHPAMVEIPPTPTPPTPEPPRTPPLLRPLNLAPSEVDYGENRRRSFHRGSVFIPRRRQDDWRVGSRRQSAAVPFIEDELRPGGGAGESVDDLDGASSPSDAWRLRQLRQELQKPAGVAGILSADPRTESGAPPF